MLSCPCWCPAVLAVLSVGLSLHPSVLLGWNPPWAALHPASYPALLWLSLGYNDLLISPKITALLLSRPSLVPYSSGACFQGLYCACKKPCLSCSWPYKVICQEFVTSHVPQDQPQTRDKFQLLALFLLEISKIHKEEESF